MGLIGTRIGALAYSNWPFDTLLCVGDFVILTLLLSPLVNLLGESSSSSGPFVDSGLTGVHWLGCLQLFVEALIWCGGSILLWHLCQL